MHLFITFAGRFHPSCIMKRLQYIFVYTFLLVVAACSESPTFHIGVSQCSEDDWRALLNQEIHREARFFGDIEVENVSANDNSRQQVADIERFIADGKDLIVVAPNVAEDVRPAIEKAYDKGIPVILIDRCISGDKYTAFIGADNSAIGMNIRSYLEKQCQGRRGNVIELRGLDGSTPAMNRHNGFMESEGELNILASVSANWNERDGEHIMDSLLGIYPEVDFVYAHNDRMALGAYHAIMRAGKEGRIKVVGVDGLATPGGGVDRVLEGKFLASHIYPTGGSEAIQLAHKILTHQAYDRETVLPTALIDSTNARVMHLQYISMKSLDDKYLRMEALTDRQLERINLQQWMLGGAIVIILLLAILLTMISKVRREKKQTDEIMMMQLQAPIRQMPENDARQENETAVKDDTIDAFRMKVEDIIIAHIGNPDFSVNDIATELCMSRVQLYRKIKAASDQNVSDLIRKARLEKAQSLLRDTNKTISEVAYIVGFSSPSYFSKCFKDEFGISPSEMKA